MVILLPVDFLENIAKSATYLLTQSKRMPVSPAALENSYHFGGNPKYIDNVSFPKSGF